jgi:prepilin-type N-terminal cleavage/methylation domain-containing protein
MDSRIVARRSRPEKMTAINPQRKQHGFTMTEIVMVMAIIGILGAFAVPSFLAWLPGYKLKSAVRDLQGHLQTAKYEAIQRGGNVSVNFTPPPPCGCVNCYQIFVDDVPVDRVWQGNVCSVGNEILLRQVNMPTNITLTGATANLTFNSRGIPNVGATITLQNNQNTSAQAVILPMGRVNILRSINGGAYQQWD